MTNDRLVKIVTIIAIAVVAVVLCNGSPTVMASDIFRADITKGVQGCGLGDFTAPTRDVIWLDLSQNGILTFSIDADFENTIQLATIRYLRFADREEFMAIASNEILPDFEPPAFGAGFVSIYGKVTLDDRLRPIAVRGELHGMFLDDLEQECFTRMKFRSVE